VGHFTAKCETIRKKNRSGKELEKRGDQSADVQPGLLHQQKNVATNWGVKGAEKP